jgi:hypothetical protein
MLVIIPDYIYYYKIVNDPLSFEEYKKYSYKNNELYYELNGISKYEELANELDLIHFKLRYL